MKKHTELPQFFVYSISPMKGVHHKRMAFASVIWLSSVADGVPIESPLLTASTASSPTDCCSNTTIDGSRIIGWFLLVLVWFVANLLRKFSITIKHKTMASTIRAHFWDAFAKLRNIFCFRFNWNSGRGKCYHLKCVRRTDGLLDFWLRCCSNAAWVRNTNNFSIMKIT